MKTICVYRHQELSAEKLKNAYNLNLMKNGCWKYLFKRFVPDEYITNDEKPDEKLLTMIADHLDEMGEDGDSYFDVRVQKGNQGFKSLMGKEYLTL